MDTLLSKEKHLSNKVAVVTGGTRGIGRAIAQRLLQAGASVAFCGRSAENVARAAEEMTRNPGGTVFGEAVDVSKPEQGERVFKKLDRRFKRVDILAKNSGVR